MILGFISKIEWTFTRAAEIGNVSKETNLKTKILILIIIIERWTLNYSVKMRGLNKHIWNEFLTEFKPTQIAI